MGTLEITLGHLLETYYRESNDFRDRGDKFERLVRSYLTTDQAWASQFSEVWLWKDYPERGTRTDTGIDLVAKDRFTGELTAIQCKFLEPEQTVSKGDIDSFISASPKPEFSRRLLAHTASIGPKAQQTLEAQDPPVQVLDPHQMDRADIQWAEFQVAYPDRMVHKSSRKKTPFPYQRDAMADVAAGFQTSERGKLIMACGTGKTFTSLQIMQDQTPADAKVLFLVPSIALLDQTLREWKRDAAEDFRALAVCSDVKVGKNKAEEDISTTDLLVPATTDAAHLIDQLRQAGDYDGRTVVFSTYQSIDVIHQAQQHGLGEFDLIICDEAHRTTGATATDQDQSAFTKIHDNSFVAGAKRLYMTATPRVFDEGAKKKADENSVVVASMDDEQLYGPEFHRLGFGKAVAQGLLTDYKVLVLAVDETSVNNHLQGLLTDEEGELGIDDVAKIVGCWNGLSHRGQQDNNDATASRAMQRAVAFASNIKESKRVASMFEKITEKLAATSDETVAGHHLICRAEHVDGGMNVAQRSAKLNWLEATPQENEARILTNARCLSEGVDVPSLDAVLFLNPRNSQVDVVQSVGRVMRRAQGKDYGYIILPVGVPVGTSPEQALKDSKKYKVIWSVLNALRSHDDRFEATVNKIDLNQGRGEKIDIIGVGVGKEDDDATVTTPQQLTLELEFPGLEEWKDAIYAKIVQKVGDRKYWETWADDIAEVAQRHTQRITALVEQDPTPEVAERFEQFVEALKHNLNPGITATDAISMLSQHLITKPVFDAIFEGYDFAANNPVSVVMQQMIDTLEGNNLQAETASLDGFYKSVAERAAGIDNPEGKQRIITELYENFFKQAFPAQADALGVVYTPVEIVDFIIRAVDDLSKEHFGAGITDEGVHVLDPFTGTGTFIVRLLQSGVITPHDLARKYAEELHANEIMLLAYYIAAINIEATYHGLIKNHLDSDADQVPYRPFAGIVLGDTFQMTEEDNTFDLEIFTSNNERARRQLDTDIRVIIGNPPYSAGQTSANDNNANASYPSLDERIRTTYAARTTGQNKNSLYDSYIRAIRWGTDRIGDRGILAYVSNGGYIDSNSADGLRKTFVEDFDHLYIYNLRGNARTSGELRRKEKDNVFESGSRATVAIMIGVKDPTHTGNCVLYYRDIGDYLTREDKLGIIRESTITSTAWEIITPNSKGEWINQSSDIFDTLPPLGDKKSETGQTPVFRTYSPGLQTNRDAWVYNFSREAVERNVNAMTETYDQVRRAYHAEPRPKRNEKDVAAWLTTHPEFSDPARISWSSTLRNHVTRDTRIETSSQWITTSSYRPFAKQNVYFHSHLNHRPGQLPSMFPTPSHPNHGFYLNTGGTNLPFCLLATDAIPDLNFFGQGGQFFARYTWEPVATAEPDLLSGLSDSSDRVVVDGYRRVDNITDATLARYQEAFGQEVTKDAIFAHIYVLLHSEQYRSTFAAELKRQLPRIPLAASESDFWAFASAGQKLLDLHINYENSEPYPLEETVQGDTSAPGFYRVQKMKWGGKARSADKSQLVYNANITLNGIPDEAHQYMLGSRSGLEWLIDRYQVKTDKNSGITNDPNDWAEEHGDSRYILDLVKKITTVSLETVQIIRTLPGLDAMTTPTHSPEGMGTA
ncbi:DEAD/DEAH box helicase [Nesterenkonia marinintestina]|uniref:DEAD/DEAH box helicase n=1 Tax=Nesterenkonia marinintestina TaxID=2979865 RepID=UPI0021C1DE04|nr:type ISP restriction/modification enzyme [Nesterenkonia sp. GX14115]